jgi:hypothetical protein
MKRFCVLICLCGTLVCKTFAQDSLKRDTAKTNPIIFANGNIGFGIAGLSGISVGGTVNYQFKSNLFTFRASNITRFHVGLYSPYLPLPIIEERDVNIEYALMYGLRIINGNKSYSFSAGVSTNQRTFKYYDENNQVYRTTGNYVGIPFELTALWFNSIKKRYRIYYIIPVGKPTGFSRSIGFKLLGNLSKNSYVALGIVYGFGFHKHY